MIREYQDGDINGMELNGLTLGINKDEFIALLPQLNAVSVVSNNSVKVIIAFYEYDEKCYYGFILASKEMSISDGKEVKRYIDNKMKELKALRLETTSLDNDILNKWHLFLGFELEGTKRKYFNGKDYKMWGRLNGN